MSAKVRRATVSDLDELARIGTDDERKLWSGLADNKYKSKQYVDAARLYQKAVDRHNDAYSQNCLADCYYKGQGVNMDHRQAIVLYTRSARQGYAHAQQNLAECYATIETIHEIMDHVALYRNDRSCESRPLVKKKRMFHRAALLWYEKAAEQGLAESQFRLAQCLYEGMNGSVSVDRTNAIKWCKEANKQGHKGAEELLDDILNNPDEDVPSCDLKIGDRVMVWTGKRSARGGEWEMRTVILFGDRSEVVYGKGTNDWCLLEDTYMVKNEEDFASCGGKVHLNDFNWDPECWCGPEKPIGYFLETENEPGDNEAFGRAIRPVKKYNPGSGPASKWVDIPQKASVLQSVDEVLDLGVDADSPQPGGSSEQTQETQSKGNSNLSPQAKAGTKRLWSNEERELLNRLVKERGTSSKDWSEKAKLLNTGRTSRAVMSFYYSTLRPLEMATVQDEATEILARLRTGTASSDADPVQQMICFSEGPDGIDLPDGSKYKGDWKGGASCGTLQRHGKGTWTNSDGAKYEGDFQDDKKHGKGTYTWPDGSKYEGYWKDGFRHGKGTETWPDGYKYEGDFQNGERHGKGTETWPDGRKYEGYWKDGERNGKGTVTLSDGRKYKGDWKNDKKHGKGTYTWPDGSKYEGDWKDDKRHGKGTWAHPDGNKYEGDYQDGKRHGKGTETWPDGYKYEGDYQDGKRHGKGTMNYADKSVYEGEWQNDEHHGQGTLIFHEPQILFTDVCYSRYEGGWKDGLQHGKGILAYTNGDTYQGTWQNGKTGTYDDNHWYGEGRIIYTNGDEYTGSLFDNVRHGKGTMAYAEGAEYKGDWHDGKRHGKGAWTRSDGVKYEGDWQNDKRHGKGTYTYGDKAKYEGDWQEDEEHGKGIYTEADGSKYEGDWQNGKEHGKGTMTYVGEAEYEGDWKEGKWHGKGTYTELDGSKYEGDWQDGKRHGKGTNTYGDKAKYEGDWERCKYEDDWQNNKIKYEGDWQNDKWHGKGTMTFSDGSVYEGDFQDGNRHGKGIMTELNGTKYEGAYQDDQPHGKGTFINLDDGNKYEGEWQNGAEHGKGTMTWSDGSVYEGDFQDGLRHGKGTWTRSDGVKTEGDWKYDFPNGKGTQIHTDGRKYEGDFQDGKMHGNGTMTYPDGSEYEGEWQDGRAVNLLKRKHSVFHEANVQLREAATTKDFETHSARRRKVARSREIAHGDGSRCKAKHLHEVPGAIDRECGISYSVSDLLTMREELFGEMLDYLVSKKRVHILAVPHIEKERKQMQSPTKA